MTTLSTITYLGFDVNGRECEIFLGDAFESHLPSCNRIVVRTPLGEREAAPGDVLAKDSIGCWVEQTYVPDQAAVDWARARVERVIGKYKAWEAKAIAEGNQERARRWRTACFVLEHELIGVGCVIGPFHERRVSMDSLLRQLNQEEGRQHNG